MKDFYDYQTTGSGFKLQLSNSLTFAEREIHPYHEILYCPDAHAVLHTENRRLKLSGKNLLLIPKGQYHLLDPLNCQSFPRLKIAISDDIISRIPDCALFSGIYVSNALNLHTQLLLNQISDILPKSQADMHSFYLTSAIMMLLAELNTTPLSAPGAYRENNALMVQITEYISQNLAGDLSVENLAKLFCVSPSFLTHRFQKEIGIPLHRYITQKRMITAWAKIDSGCEPTKIYSDCGYKDYSSFYKAYCKFFSTAPSAQSKPPAER